MRCGCGQNLVLRTIEETDDFPLLMPYECQSCGVGIGVEATVQDASSILSHLEWTDEARYQLERLPPYVEALIRDEVERYAQEQHVQVITSGLIREARNQGRVSWNPEAESRLSRVPAPVRAMARVELERTALDRGLPEVTVALMEEVKARYFGMAAQS